MLWILQHCCSSFSLNLWYLLHIPCKIMASCWAEDFLNATSRGEEASMDCRLRTSLVSTLVCDTGTCAFTAEVIWSTINKSAAFSAWIPWTKLFLFSRLASFVRLHTTDSKPLVRSLESVTNMSRSAPLSLSSAGKVMMSPSAVTCPPVTPCVATSSSIHWSSPGSIRTQPWSWGRETTNPSSNFFQSSPLMLRRPSSRVVMSSKAKSLICEKQNLK